MAIPKFFTKNRLRDNCTFTFTTALTTLAPILYDRNRDNVLSSSGSNDATPEIWTIEFSGAQTIDTIVVDNHNIKSGNVKYWNGTAYVNFSTPATWSANALTTSIFTFNSVSTLKIQITMNTTITTDAQKSVGLIYAFATLGSPSRAPSTIDRQFTEDSREHKKTLGGTLYVFFGKSLLLKYLFTDATESDMNFFISLKNYPTEFYIWPCGSSQNASNDIGLRVYDFYLVNFVNDFKPDFKSNVIGIGTRIPIDFKEV